MHVGIAYPRWRGKRSRHSRRMRIRNFMYLAIDTWRHIIARSIVQLSLTEITAYRSLDVELWDVFLFQSLICVLFLHTVYCIWYDIVLNRNKIIYDYICMHTSSFIQLKWNQLFQSENRCFLLTSFEEGLYTQPLFIVHKTMPCDNAYTQKFVVERNDRYVSLISGVST